MIGFINAPARAHAMPVRWRGAIWCRCCRPPVTSSRQQSDGACVHVVAQARKPYVRDALCEPAHGVRGRRRQRCPASSIEQPKSSNAPPTHVCCAPRPSTTRPVFVGEQPRDRDAVYDKMLAACANAAELLLNAAQKNTLQTLMGTRATLAAVSASRRKADSAQARRAGHRRARDADILDGRGAARRWHGPQDPFSGREAHTVLDAVKRADFDAAAQNRRTLYATRRGPLGRTHQRARERAQRVARPHAAVFARDRHRPQASPPAAASTNGLPFSRVDGLRHLGKDQLSDNMNYRPTEHHGISRPIRMRRAERGKVFGTLFDRFPVPGKYCPRAEEQQAQRSGPTPSMHSPGRA